jgi:hypothetical protein
VRTIAPEFKSSRRSPSPKQLFNHQLAPEVASSENVIAAAVKSQYFSLSYREFSDIMSLPDDARQSICGLISSDDGGKTASAVIEAVCLCQNLNIAFDYKYAASKVGSMPLSDREKEEQLFHLKLYLLADLVIRERRPLPEHLSFLGHALHRDTVWDGFLGLFYEWERRDERSDEFFNDFESEALEKSYVLKSHKLADPRKLLDLLPDVEGF